MNGIMKIEDVKKALVEMGHNTDDIRDWIDAELTVANGYVCASDVHSGLEITAWRELASKVQQEVSYETFIKVLEK